MSDPIAAAEAAGKARDIANRFETAVFLIAYGIADDVGPAQPNGLSFPCGHRGFLSWVGLRSENRPRSRKGSRPVHLCVYVFMRARICAMVLVCIYACARMCLGVCMPMCGYASGQMRR